MSMKKQILSKGIIKRWLYIEKITNLVVKKSPILEWYPLEDYLIEINYDTQENYQYDPKEEKLYVDRSNEKANLEKLIKDKEYVASLEKEGKNEEEIQELIKDLGVDHFDRIEVVVQCDWLIEKIKEFIKVI